MKKICIVTATRAEFGLLLPVIKKLKMCKDITTEIVVTGAHLSHEFGLTVNEILSTGLKIDRKIDILLSADSPASISKTMGVALISFADYFTESKPDALLLLGDRYEMLAIACAAANERIPIFHMFGGDTTEGAIDEAVRHAITKMSYVHFTATEKCRKRVIQLGENPKNVFCVGTTGVENVLNLDLISREELEKQLGLYLGNSYALATFHPVTLEDDNEESQIEELIKAIEMHKEINFIFTKANADAGGRRINQKLEEAQKWLGNLHLFDSLGIRKYLSVMKYASFVIGNSSSGIGEAPILKIPTVNIGNRQRGREMPKSVVSCLPIADEISNAINKVLSKSFREEIMDTESIYGDGHTSDKIIAIIEKILNQEYIDIKKKFYDIEYTII